MDSFFRLVGPNRAVELFGVKLVGINAENGMKVLVTLIFIILVMAINHVVMKWARSATRRGQRIAFWTRQGIHVLTAVVLLLGTVSIWFDDPTRLTTAMGLVTAGLAFALQRVVTALAGYVLILRGNTFNVGDRIVMGGVRGDVINLGFMQTTIMEMGQPPPVQNADPAMWIKARQYTGRIVTVTNAKVFDEPVFNYSREFPYIWEEMTIPIAFKDDHTAAEKVLLDAARKHTLKTTEMAEEDLKELERRYAIPRSDLEPRVFWRITDNWLEMSVRFLGPEHGIRGLKDALSREILKGLESVGIGIASGTFGIVEIPDLRIQRSK